MTSLDPVVIREALAGYQAANDVIEAERREELAQTTSAESWAQWREMVSSYNIEVDWPVDIDRLDLWEVEGLLVIRRAMDLLAESQGFI